MVSQTGVLFRFSVVCIVVVASMSESYAARNTGVGIGGGSWLAGLTVKHYLVEQNAVQGIMGLTNSGLALEMDYLSRMGPLSRTSAMTISWGLGAGIGIVSHEEAGGLEGGALLSGIGEIVFDFSEAPLELVLDYRPAYRLGGAGWGMRLFQFGGAIRYFF